MIFNIKTVTNTHIRLLVGGSIVYYKRCLTDFEMIALMDILQF